MKEPRPEDFLNEDDYEAAVEAYEAAVEAYEDALYWAEERAMMEYYERQSNKEKQ